jgi:hypothetical protein
MSDGRLQRYLQKAEECQRAAAVAADDIGRIHWLGIMDSWLALADAERSIDAYNQAWKTPQLSNPGTARRQ